MRRLMWFSMGFCVGCAMGVWLLPAHAILPAGIINVFIMVGAAAIRKYRWLRQVSVCAMGIAAALFWFRVYDGQYLKPAALLDGTQQYTVVTATDFSYETGYGLGVDGEITIAQKRYKVRVYVDGDIPVSPGDRIAGTFRFRLTTPGGRSEATYHSGSGTFLLLYQRGEIQIEDAKQMELRFAPAVLARRISILLKECFPEDTFPFAKALLLGDAQDLSYAQNTALQISGIRHVVAVSGLHVSILFALISILTFKNRFFTLMAGLPVLLLFAAMAGFTPSVTRACIMTALMLLGQMLDQEYDGGTALSFAVLVMLCCNPLAITSVSLQLSAASVSGIFLLHERIQHWIVEKLGNLKGKSLKARLLRWFAGSVSVSLSATVFTTPLCAFYFGAVSLVGVLTNLLTLWVISFVFYGIMLVCLVEFIWHSAAVFLAALVSVPIRYVLLSADILSQFPLAAVYTCSVYIILWLVFCYGVLILCVIRRNHPPVVPVCWCAIGLCAALLASWVEPLTDDVRMTVLDVGQGQSILLQSEGRTFLVDCGGDSDTETADMVAETLLSHGVTRLDGIILTHFDRDHSGGLPYLLTRMESACLIIPQGQEEWHYPEEAGTVLPVTQELLLEYGDSSITIYGSRYTGSGNENSLCILFETENCAILITGDRSSLGEKLLMRYADLPEVDVLIAGHHGAEDSSCLELLQTVNPDTVIISAGENNIYGHPAQATLQRLLTFGCTVLRTDQDGTILYRR